MNADLKIDERLSSRSVLLAASASFLFCFPPSFLLPLASPHCLLSALSPLFAARSDGRLSLSNKMQHFGKEGEFSLSVSQSVCLSLLLLALISAALLTNRQVICLSPCASSVYIWFLFMLHSYLFVVCSLQCSFLFLFLRSTHRHPRPFIYPTHSNVVLRHHQEFSIREYDTEETGGG